MKSIFLFAALLFSCTTMNAVTKLLSGNPVGSLSYNYTTGSSSTTVNTAANLFDNNVNTIFAANDRTRGWAGLDLGEKYVIKRVAFCPRAAYASRMQLGIFEGANNADFSDAIPIGIITEIPKDNIYTTIKITCSMGFRYVRYVGPNDARCNVAELRFYGEAGEGDSTQYCQMTNLPLVVIRTTNAQDITSRTEYLNGTVKVITEDGKNLFSDSLKIRGRGNASWLYPKQPFKIKLNHKAHMVGLPAKAKDWTLINNWGDKTLIRNMVAFETSRRMKMNYSPAATLVNVIVNSEYEGCYQLCDQLEVGKDRIDITKMDATCVKVPEITGGYLIEIDANAGSEPVHFTSNKGTPVTVKYPKDDEITSDQLDYIRSTFNTMEAKVYSIYYTDDINGYVSALDVNSFLKHFLVGEYTGNTDTYWSVYLSKERGSFERFKAAAVWDFDLALENDARTYPINNLSSYLSLSSRSSHAGDMKYFVSRIVNTQTNTIKKLWTDARNSGLTWENMSTYVDSLTEVINESQQLNFIRWKTLDQKVHQNFQALGSYQAEVDFMKQYMKARFTWMDNKIGYVSGVEGIDGELAGNIVGGEGKIIIQNFTPRSSYSIFTLDGKLLSEGVMSTTNTEVEATRGFYVVRVVSPNGRLQQQKILIE